LQTGFVRFRYSLHSSIRLPLIPERAQRAAPIRRMTNFPIFTGLPIFYWVVAYLQAKTVAPVLLGNFYTRSLSRAAKPAQDKFSDVYGSSDFLLGGRIFTAENCCIDFQ